MDRLSIILSTIRIRRSLRQRRMDAKGGYAEEPAGWITLKSNGEHVPLNEQGEAIGGAGGWAKGKSFANAKVVKKAKKAVGAVASAGKEAARKALTTARQKCSDIYDKHIKTLYLKYEWDTKRKELRDSIDMSQKAIEREEAEIETLKKGVRAVMGKKSIGDLEDDANEEWDTFQNLKDERDTFPKGSDEWNKKDAEIEEHLKRYSELKSAIVNHQQVQDRMKGLRAQKRVHRKLEKALADREAKGPGEEYHKFAEEYEEAVKERDSAVLSAFNSADECETAQEATDYLRAKGYFRGEGDDSYESDQKVEISKMTDANARACAVRMEKMMQDYPGLKGKLGGIDCHDFSINAGDYTSTYGYANGTRVSFAQGYFGDSGKVPEGYRGDAAENYKNDVKSGFHPKGTSHDAIVDHEMAHAIEKLIKARAKDNGIELFEGSVADTVMKRVQEKLYGSYETGKEDAVRRSVSRYAAVNKGINENGLENSSYGRNTEFLAEAMAEARCSDNPSEVALAVREVMEDMMRRTGLM